jgi:hypothetical protein
MLRALGSETIPSDLGLTPNPTLRVRKREAEEGGGEGTA